MTDIQKEKLKRLRKEDILRMSDYDYKELRRLEKLEMDEIVESSERALKREY